MAAPNSAPKLRRDLVDWVLLAVPILCGLLLVVLALQDFPAILRVAYAMGGLILIGWGLLGLRADTGDSPDADPDA